MGKFGQNGPLFQPLGMVDWPSLWKTGSNCLLGRETVRFSALIIPHTWRGKSSCQISLPANWKIDFNPSAKAPYCLTSTIIGDGLLFIALPFFPKTSLHLSKSWNLIGHKGKLPVVISSSTEIVRSFFRWVVTKQRFLTLWDWINNVTTF